MIVLHCSFMWILFALVDSHSPLTEKKTENGVKSSCESNEIVINNLQNQLNQETVIRLSLLKQVYALVNDMISVKNEMEVMKTSVVEIRKDTDDLKHEEKEMKSEIEQMKVTHNDTSKKMINVQNYLLNINNSVDILRNYTDEINANNGIQENRMRDLVTKQEKIQSTLDDLQNEDQRILSETKRMIANHCEKTLEKILKMREDLVQNITSMVKDPNSLSRGQDCLNSSNCWLMYKFKYDDSWNGCEGGTQYVKKTNYSSTPYLGVMTCSSTRYKLFLSKALIGKYYNIADGSGIGEDHCELLGTVRRGVLPLESGEVPNTGFYRKNRGEPFLFGEIGNTPNIYLYYQKWIECGVNIPGNDRVIPLQTWLEPTPSS